MPLAPKPSCRQTKIGNHCSITVPGASDASRDRRTQRVMEAPSRRARGKPPISMPGYLTALGLPCPIAGIPCHSATFTLPSQLYHCRELPGRPFWDWHRARRSSIRLVFRGAARIECRLSAKMSVHGEGFIPWKWRVSSGKIQRWACGHKQSALAVCVGSPIR